MIVEKENVFEIPATDHLVVASWGRDPWSIRLELQSDEVRWTLSIRSTFSLKRFIETEPVPAMEVLPDLIGESVLVVFARKADGKLEIKFSQDWILIVEADPNYEAWEMHSSRGERLIATPGDGVAKWGESRR